MYNIKLKLICGEYPFIIEKPLMFIFWCWELIFPTHFTNWAWKIRFFFNPRQKWIKKHISYNEWCDKPELITDFLFGCVVHFIEEEKTFEMTVMDEPPWKEFGDFIKECYNYIKVDRPALEKKIENSFSVNYGEWKEFQKELEEKDMKYLTKIVKYKEQMWT